MKAYESIKIGQNRGSPRLWLEGMKASMAGFLPGKRFSIRKDEQRNMLVLEEGDTLWLARAAPEEWLRPGRSIAVNSAPTALGTVSCRISRLADGIARVSVAPPKNADLKHIKIRLRVPGGPPIAAVTGADSVRFSGDTISVETPSRPLDLTVRFGAAPR